MHYQVKWVSAKGRYSSRTFKTLDAAKACKERHEKWTGRPARIVAKAVLMPLERNPWVVAS